jgi:hypothetical protein
MVLHLETCFPTAAVFILYILSLTIFLYEDCEERHLIKQQFVLYQHNAMNSRTVTFIVYSEISSWDGHLNFHFDPELNYVIGTVFSIYIL